MKNSRSLIVLGLLAAASQFAYAVCNGSSNCELPAGNGSAASWTASASGVTGIQALNSVGPSGNDVGSRYFFAAVTTNLGATTSTGTISTTGDGTQVIGSFALNSNGTPGSTVTGGVVNSLLGGQSYFFYAQACPSGQVLDSGRCSKWAQIGSKSSLAYPASVFSAPVKPTDANTNSIAARTNVPTADLGNISQIQLEVDNLITPALNQTGLLIGWPGVNQSNAVDNSLYTNGGGFKPNVKYQYKGQVFYPYGTSVPTGGAQTEGPFWTTPVDPSNVVVSNITHCSAQITARNTGGSTGNPTYTSYNLCASGTSGSCLAGNIGGTGAPTDTIAKTIVGLQPGTAYTPNAQAMVGDNDGSQTGWNSSTIVNGSGFTTSGNSGTFTATNITTTSADFNFPAGFDVTGAVSYQMVIDGVVGAVVNTPPPSTINVPGLTSNTQHSLRIQVNEGSCSYTVPAAPGVQFFTLPVAPTAGSFGSPTTTTIPTNWTDGSTNPNTTTYHLQYSSDGGSTWTDFGTNPTKVSGSAQSGTISGLTPETTYNVRVKTVSASGNPANDSAYFPIPGTADTLNAAPVVSALNCTAPSGSPSTSTCSDTVSDNASTAQLICHWSATGPQTVGFSANDYAASGTACAAVTATFPINGSYIVTLTVTDHAGSGLAGSRNTTVNVGTTPTSMTVIPSTGATVATGSSVNFVASVNDQFGNPMPGLSVNWVISGGGNLSTASGPSSIYTATTPGSFTITASVGSVTPVVKPITVIAAGAFFVTQPSLTLNPDHKTGTLSALGNDNVSGEPSIAYTWSLESGPAGASLNFSANGTNAAKNSVVTFNKAGSYTIRCTLSNSNGSTFADTALTILPQVLSAIGVTPTNVTISVQSNQVFAAVGKDQFGDSMTIGTVTWTSTGGNVSGVGVFQSNSLGNNIRVTATSNGVSGSATVNLVDYDVSGAVAGPVPYKSTTSGGVITFFHLGTSAKIRIYSTTGRLVFSAATSSDTFPWGVVNSAGERIASGVYLYVIESPTTTKHGKLIIIQ